MRHMGFAVGLLIGVASGAAGVAMASEFRLEDGDHYATEWTVLADGEVVCPAPYIRPREREIECRSARRAPR